MEQNFILIFKNIKIYIPKDLNYLEKISRKIHSEILIKQEYVVELNVHYESFQIFLNYWLKNIKPSFNSENTYEINLLIEEFELKSHNKTLEYDELLKVSILKSSFLYNHDKSSSEEYIAGNLDFYLLNYNNDLYDVPINSLYNIFYHKKRALNNYSLAFNSVQYHIIQFNMMNK